MNLFLLFLYFLTFSRHFTRSIVNGSLSVRITSQSLWWFFLFVLVLVWLSYFMDLFCLGRIFKNFLTFCCSFLIPIPKGTSPSMFVFFFCIIYVFWSLNIKLQLALQIVPFPMKHRCCVLARVLWGWLPVACISLYSKIHRYIFSIFRLRADSIFLVAVIFLITLGPLQ